MKADLCKVYLVKLICTFENNHVSGFSEFPFFSNTPGKGRVWEKVTDARPNLADINQLPVWVFSVLLSLLALSISCFGGE